MIIFNNVKYATNDNELIDSLFKDGSITRKGCGMDMIFDTLYGLYNALGIEDYSGLACHYAMI